MYLNPGTKPMAAVIIRDLYELDSTTRINLGGTDADPKKNRDG